MTINMIIELITILSIKVISLLILYKTIYWRGINIGDFSEKSPILKSPIINNYMDTPTKPLLKTKKLKKKDVVAQIANKNLPIASHRQIRQILLSYYSRQ